jgi:hypothetical protein
MSLEKEKIDLQFLESSLQTPLHIVFLKPTFSKNQFLKNHNVSKHTLI